MISKEPASAPSRGALTWLARLTEHARIGAALLLGIALIVAGVIGPDRVHDQAWNEAFAVSKELGYAFLIAVILTFTLEKYAKDRHISAVKEHQRSIEDVHAKQVMEIKNLQKVLKENLLNAVYENRLPKSTVEYIVDHLLTSPYRRDLRLKVAFKRVERDLAVEITTEYAIESPPGAETWHRVPFHRLEGANGILGQRRGDQIWIEDKELDPRKDESDEFRYFEGAQEVQVRVRPGTTRKVKHQYSVGRRKAGIEIWANEVLSDCVSVSLEKPEDLETTLLVTTTRKGPALVQDGSTWKYTGPLLPGQAIVISWADSAG